MNVKLGNVLEKPVCRSVCKHHWLIEPPEGPTSKGVCKLCGEIKMFDNILADLLSISDSVTPSEPGGLVEGEAEDSGDAELP